MKRTIAVALTFAFSLGCAQQDGGGDKSVAAPPPAAKGERGNWDVIDTNKDNYIQAEEMEKWLAANPGPSAAKK